jgi:hypothetical protein
MEAIGLAETVQELFDTHNTYIHEYIGDNDSSTKKVMRHLWQEDLDCGMREELPKYSNEEKKDNGLLPIDHPSIILSDNLQVNCLHYVEKKGQTVRAH